MMRFPTFIYMLILLTGAAPFNGVEIGEEAPGFVLNNIDNSSVSLMDYLHENGVVVVFISNTCPYSEEYDQRLITLHNKYADKGFPLVAIQPNNPIRSPGDSFAEMKKRSEEMHFPFPWLLDETQDVTRYYGATDTPSVFVLAIEDGLFILKYKGAWDNGLSGKQDATECYVEEVLDSLLNGTEVENAVTKPTGCPIVWKAGERG